MIMENLELTGLNIMYAWLIFAVIMAIAEVLTPWFGFILIGLSGIPSALLAFLKLSWEAQLAAFAFCNVLAIFFIRPRIVKKLYSSPGVPDRAQALVGKTGQITQAITPPNHFGRVVINGEDWAAESEAHLPEGIKVRVVGIDGITLRVEKT